MIIMRFEKGKSLKSLTSLGIGGIASFFAEIKKEKELKKIFQEAGGKRYVIGAGSNLVAPDSGFFGFIIKIGIKAFEIKRNANLDTEQACSKRGKTGLSSARNFSSKKRIQQNCVKFPGILLNSAKKNIDKAYCVPGVFSRILF